MTQLPGAASATLDDSKIRDYLLNPAHPIGLGKERFFRGYGFSPAHWTALRAALLGHPMNNPVTGQSHNDWGSKYEVRCSIKTPDQRNPCIVSIWIIDAGADPRFVTAYPSQ